MLSYSGITKFLSCPRSYDFAYRQNLQLRREGQGRSRLLGSAFHAGLEIGLVNMPDAKKAAHNYLQSTITDTTPQEYAALLDDIYMQVADMLDFYLPQLGDRYQVLRICDVLPDQTDTGLMIEHQFEATLKKGVSVKGKIDAVLLDTVTGEHVVVDWKTRASFPSNDLAAVDGQLYLYAAVLNSVGANITRVIMWQFRTKLPTKPELSVKKGQPTNEVLTGRASYDSIFSYWSQYLPVGHDPEKYREVMQPKMKTIDAWINKVEGIVTPTSSQDALSNLLSTAMLIKQAERLPLMPGVLNSQKCKGCDYLRLCSEAIRHGLNTQPIIEQYYEPRKGEFDEADTEPE